MKEKPTRERVVQSALCSLHSALRDRGKPSVINQAVNGDKNIFNISCPRLALTINTIQVKFSVKKNEENSVEKHQFQQNFKKIYFM